MICKQCGAQIPDDTTFCGSCGAHQTNATDIQGSNQGISQNNNQGTNGGNRPSMPEDYLVWAILTTVFCCLPFGIISIIKSVNVKSAYNNGHYEEARKNSEDAKKWAKYGAITGAIVFVITFVVSFIAGLSGAL